jgi:hypothetical protein
VRRLLFLCLFACSKPPPKPLAIVCGDPASCIGEIEKAAAPALSEARERLVFHVDAGVRSAYFAAARRLSPEKEITEAARALLNDADQALQESAAFWLCEHGVSDGCDKLGVDFERECQRQRQLTQVGFMLYRAQDDNEPAEIGYVCPGSPAESAGLAAGDVVRTIDGHESATIARLQLHLRFAIQHLPAKLVVGRGSSEATLTVTSRKWR